jgi:hypothetical protein
MKKKLFFFKILTLSFVMMLGFSSALFSQGITLPFQSDFSALGGSSESSSASMPAITAANIPEGFLFAGSDRIYQGGQKIKFGVAASIGILPTDVINPGSASFIKVTFDALAWPTTQGKSATILLVYGEQTTEILIEGRPGWPVVQSDLTEYSCQFTAISTPASLFFKTTDPTSENECRFFLDNVRITDASSTPQVANPTFTPPGGTYSDPQNVTINCATEGAIIRYTLDGTEPLVTSTEFSTPIVISTTTTIKARAWKDDLNPSTVSTANYVFSQSVTTLAELRALAPNYIQGSNQGTIVYKYTGNAVVTHVQEFNNVKYIQDETAAIMIFDQGAKISGVQEGDKITNLSGTLTNYWGMLQIIPSENCDPVSWDNKVVPTVITASQLDFDNENPVQAKVVKINNVFYTEQGTFGKGIYYNLKENDMVYDSVVYTDKFEAEYIGQPIPTIAVDIIGICIFKGTTGIKTKNRIVPMDVLNAVQLKISDYNKSAIRLAPNPASNFVNVVTGAPMKLEVYSLLGNLIATETLSEGSNIISVSNYTAGMYIMKLIDTKTGQAFTQKLVIK